MRSRIQTDLLALVATSVLLGAGCDKAREFPPESGPPGPGDQATRPYTKQLPDGYNAPEYSRSKDAPAGVIGDGEELSEKDSQTVQLDLDKISYEERRHLLSYFQPRLEKAEADLNQLQNHSGTRPERATRIKAMSEDLAEIKQKLRRVDTIERNQWEHEKKTFRDEVVAMEQSIESLKTARR